MKAAPGAVSLVVFTFFAAACGSAPTPAAPRPTTSSLPVPPPSVEAAVRACVLVSACSSPEDPLREPAACVSRFLAHKDHDPSVTCLVRARTCRDVESCLGRERVPDDARRACDARPGAIVFCDGDRLVSCENERTKVTSCTELRASCRELRVAGGIVARGCYSPALCPDDAPAQRCEAGIFTVSCQQGLVERSRCPAGTKCVEGPGQNGEVEATCTPLGARPCLPEAIDRCDGGKLVSCVAAASHRGVAVETDCAAAGLTCQTLGREGACVAADFCEPAPARCEGGALRFCAAGMPVRAHCERYGLGPCRTEGGAAQCAAPR